MKLLVSLFGLVLVLEGLPYAAFPKPMQKWLRQMATMPPQYLRIFGFLAMAVGLFLCYLTQRTAVLG